MSCTRRARRQHRVRVPLNSENPPHDQEIRVDIPGVGEKVQVTIWANDFLTVPGMFGRSIFTRCNHLVRVAKKMKGNIDDFYYLSRAILVKDEKHYDKFDKAFDIYFKGIEKLEDIFQALIPHGQDQYEASPCKLLSGGSTVPNASPIFGAGWPQVCHWLL